MKRGSITVYLCLVLCVIVALIFAALNSARYSCARAMISLAAEEGLFSLFGEYDRILYKDYGLLLIDGGYESGSLKAGALMEETASVMEKVMNPGFSALLSSPSGLFRTDIDKKAITGYVLATDSGGEAIRRQIHDLMLQKLGTDAAQSLYERYLGAADQAENAENESSEERMERLKQEYEARKEEAKEKQAEEEENEAEPVQVPDDFVNPIETVYRLKRLGIMVFAIPDPSRISGGSVNKSALASARSFQKGMGILPEYEASASDRFLLSKYITDFFPCFLDETDGVFKYQAEYALVGYSRDVDNLRSVMNRLLLLRETMNYVHIYLDEEKQAETMAMAAVIASILLIPEAVELVQSILMLCWAFAESMVDIKTLLSGGKVPLIKNKSEWHLALSDLADLSVDTSAQGNQNGFDYREYLIIFLMMRNDRNLMKSIMDLLEYNRRIKGESPAFSIDTCISSMEIQIGGCIGSKPYTLTRSFGYDSGI